MTAMRIAEHDRVGERGREIADREGLREPDDETAEHRARQVPMPPTTAAMKA